jgi:ComF family protein
MLNAWRLIADGLPGTCQVCGAWPARPVCEPCTQRFGRAAARCPGCAARLPDTMSRCGACLAQGASTALSQCMAAVDYAYPWDGLVARFKFRGEPGWASPMADLMLRAPGARDALAACDLLVPIPLSGARLASRGYNQAWELIKALRRSRRLAGAAPDAQADTLLRIGHRPDQHELPREQRLQNLHGAFVVHPHNAARLAGARVLLVDDVSTTGATLQAGARALLQAGAQCVSGLVFAHTPDH